jgi:RNA polymerase sigma-70 factor (ECF subfamily)
LTNKANISPLAKPEFEALFKEYFKPLTAFAYKFVKDVDEAKSIVHDVFAKVWEKREDIDLSKSVKSYLYSSVNNRSLNYVRDHNKFIKNADMSDLQIATDENDSFDFLSEEEIRRKVEDTLNAISPKVKEVFLLSRNDGLKYQEIADKLNISIKTVETHMSTALKELRKNLKEYLTGIIILLINSQL